MSADGIPRGWRKERLGNLAKIAMGQAPPGIAVADWNGAQGDGQVGLPFVQGNAEFSSRYPIPTKWCSAPPKVAEPGDTLISVRAPVGALNQANRRLAIGRGLAAVRFTAVDPRFGWHLLTLASREFSRVAQGSTFEAINSADLCNLTVLTPPEHEQVAIAEALDAIDTAIEKMRAVIQATERLCQALLQHLLTRGVPGWHTEWRHVLGIGTIPAPWDVVRLGDLLSRTQYGTNVALSDRANGVAVLRMGNLQDGGVSFEDLKWAELPPAERRELLLRPGDILFNRTNSIDLVGKVSIVRDLPCAASFASYLVRLNAKPDRADPFWLNAYLNWGPTQARIRRLATKGASQANINPTNLRSLLVPCPPLLEQGKTVEILEAVRERSQSEHTALGALSALKAVLADALLSGRVGAPMTDMAAKVLSG